MLPLLLKPVHQSFPQAKFFKSTLEALHTLAILTKKMDDRLRKRSVKTGIIQIMAKLMKPAIKNHITDAKKEIATKILMNLG